MAELMSNLEALVIQKSARDGHRYLNKEVAKAVNVSESTISRLMKGDSEVIEKTTLRVVLALCEWLDCEVGDLIIIARKAG